jgi:methanogenic corrinoid protein MtbC1
LSTLIENEIIPRLMVAHAVRPHDVVEGSAPPGDIESLARLALHVDADALLSHVDSIVARRVAVDTIMVDLIAPAARLLGTYWEEDRYNFVDVTMGLWRLQEVVREIAARVPADRRMATGGRRVLFAAVPGDQHTFGAVMIDEVFRHNGWLTDLLVDCETSQILRRVSSEWFDLVGLTVSCDCHIATLPSIISALRNVSRNPGLSIMVGGRVFAIDPDLATQVGADGTARDAKLALKVAADLVRVREGNISACS